MTIKTLIKTPDESRSDYNANQKMMTSKLRQSICETGPNETLVAMLLESWSIYVHIASTPESKRRDYDDTEEEAKDHFLQLNNAVLNRMGGKNKKKKRK
jgi:hypothetical protein